MQKFISVISSLKIFKTKSIMSSLLSWQSEALLNCRCHSHSSWKHDLHPSPAFFLCKWLQIETLINRCYSLQIVSLSAWQLWLMLSDKWKENRSQQLFSSKSLINYILMNLKRLLREPSEVYQKWRIALCKS